MPTKLDIVNQALNELGRLPVADLSNDQSATILGNTLDILLPELLLRTDWNFSIKYIANNTPLIVNISPEFAYNYELPPDYNRMDRISWQTVNFGLYYRIIDNVIMTNSRPLNYYYVPNIVDLATIPPLFYRVLVLYLAATKCMVLTQNEGLTKYLQTEYLGKLSDAIRQNDMDRYGQGTAYNDFNRQSYI